MKYGSLFSGIGGMDLGLDRSGMQCAWQVEIDDYATKVLEKHWPHVPKYRDVREVGKHNLEYVDVIGGGFPCQDVSVAGLNAGLSGERSGLWAEMFRIIREIRPRYVVVENVAVLLSRGLDRVLADLASIGFDAEWESIRASDFGAPHERNRLFIVAYPNQKYGQTGMGIEQDRACTIFTSGNQERFPIWVQTADRFVGMDDGVSGGLYRCRVSGIGNAVVPQIAEWIGRQIVEAANAR